MSGSLDRPRLHVLVGGRDLTDRCDSLVFSAVDNGGFEICTLGLPSADRPLKGLPVMVRAGLEPAWAGRVAEIADHSTHGKASKTTGCEGYRALLKDNPMQMVYVDRDYTRWSGPSVQRQIDNIAGAVPNSGSVQVAADPTPAGTPSVEELMTGAFPLSARNEAWYDAGPGNVIGAL